MADWNTVAHQIGSRDERLFFTDHEWAAIEAAASRIIPTDRDPGAREADVIVFIDRLLSGIRFLYASADGSGFLELTGRQADAWRARVDVLRTTYREGVRHLDAIAVRLAGREFVALEENQQDTVLEQLSGAGKPEAIVLGVRGVAGAGAMGFFDDGKDFFSTLILHTRQGFYADPVYGGNKDFVGWKVINFPGPKSLRDTMDGTFDLRHHWVQDYDWADLIPHLGSR
jgi:gluconate 2-dehydrogenase gamma chain